MGVKKTRRPRRPGQAAELKKWRPTKDALSGAKSIAVLKRTQKICVTIWIGSVSIANAMSNAKEVAGLARVARLCGQCVLAEASAKPTLGFSIAASPGQPT